MGERGEKKTGTGSAFEGPEGARTVDGGESHEWGKRDDDRGRRGKTRGHPGEKGRGRGGGTRP